MENVWERFANIASASEVQEAKSQFTPISAGDYTAILESLEPSQSQNGLPMLKGKFKIVESGRYAFYNQVLQNINNPQMTPVNIADAVEFVSGLTGTDVEFTNLADFANTVANVKLNQKYKIRISYGTKDLEMKFPRFKVLELLSDYENNSDLPFNV